MGAGNSLIFHITDLASAITTTAGILLLLMWGGRMFVMLRGQYPEAERRTDSRPASEGQGQGIPKPNEYIRNGKVFLLVSYGSWNEWIALPGSNWRVAQCMSRVLTVYGP